MSWTWFCQSLLVLCFFFSQGWEPQCGKRTAGRPFAWTDGRVYLADISIHWNSGQIRNCKLLTSSLISILCQIRRVRHLFSKSVLTTILNCLVFCKLFYCPTVWSGTFAHNINKLQLVQNFAARVLTNTKKFDHMLCATAMGNGLANQR